MGEGEEGAGSAADLANFYMPLPVHLQSTTITGSRLVFSSGQTAASARSIVAG